MAIKYKNAYNESDFKEYFEKYKAIYIEKNIVNENIYSINKIEFCTSCYRTSLVTTLHPNKSLILIDPDN